MSVGKDTPPTLADLRRSRAGRSAVRSAPAQSLPGLFDNWPEPEPATTAITEAAATPSHAVASAGSPLAALVPVVPRNPRPAQAVSSIPPPETRPAFQVWTVTELVQQVRAIVEGTYRTVSVEGEISNWRPAGSGHCYFTLKDGAAQLSAVLFRKQAALLRFRPRDGDTVRLRGQLSVYESRGQMQLIGESLEQVGLGALLQATRELKERLRREGLFDQKRALPAFPRCIGVITSLQGAALRDIVKVCRRRHAAVNLLVYPVAVQGANCAPQVVNALRWFSTRAGHADVVLLARGGGSWEDLHGFDDERVARAIVACALPVISGIGHATDTTIADAAADLCAPTPSAAAELLTSAHHRIEEGIARLASRLVRAGRFELLRARQRFAVLRSERMLRQAELALGRRAQRLDELALRLRTAQAQRFSTASNRAQAAEAALRENSPARRLLNLRERTAVSVGDLRRSGEALTRQRHHRLEQAGGRLEALSPLRVLERGYALVYGPDGRLLRSPEEIAAGEQIMARLAKGSLRARVEAEV